MDRSKAPPLTRRLALVRRVLVASALMKVFCMKRLLPILSIAALVAVLQPAGSAAAEDTSRFSALVFSKTNGFWHESIPYGVAAIEKLGQQHNFDVTATEDATFFSDDQLAQYDVVIFNSTNSRNGPILNAEQRAAFERYIRAGGGYTGIHSASGTEYDWEWYGELMGAFFDSHPAIQPVVIEVDDPVHPSTKDLPQLWNRTEEPYDFVLNPRGNVHVLASLDGSSYNGSKMGADHPISWCHNFDGGRSWYTGLGHHPSAFSEPLFLKHILGGIEWAAGAVAGDCGPTDEERFEKILLDGNTDDPLDIDIDARGRVFYVERGGAVKMYDPEHQHAHQIAKLDVFVQHTHGVHGITLDPKFIENHWLYIYYSPTNDDVSRVSRFTFDEATETLNLASEKILLEINSQREVNAHEGGGMDFDTKGNLYVATGDNSLPCCSGFGAFDERPGQENLDAQRSSANTNDLRGKILRIHPEADGTYTIPAGNLFAPGTAKTRPEIYVMGLRNPYRIHIDKKTNWLYWGEVGPDARTDSLIRGPKGYDEFNVARGPGNFGWPHCIADNQPYRDFDYATGISGELFDCAGGPINDSPNNTGLTKLPPAQPAWIYYPYETSTKFPELGTGGRLALGGPTYHFDPNLQSETKFPEYYDNTHFIADWTRNALFEVKPGADDTPNIINPLLPHGKFLRPIDMEFGPDGSLYLVEWGSNYGGSGRGDPNNDSGIYKINYVRPGERFPIAKASATPTSGQPPLTVRFSSAGSADPDAGDTITYAWDFDGDGTTDSTEANPTHEYTARGDVTARLTVTDKTGRTGVANLPLTIGNTAPKVELVGPQDGQVFNFGDPVRFEVRVNDAEDGSSSAGQIDCTKVITQPALGHDQHGHPLEQYTGCTGMIQTIVDEGHDQNDNIFYIVESKYTDKGGEGVSTLTAGDSAILQPRLKQAEHWTSQQGVALYDTEEPDGGKMIGQIGHGDYVSFEPVNLLGVTEMQFRVASAGTGGTIEIRTGATDGPVVGSAKVTPTGGWRTFTTVTAPVKDPGGSHELFLVFKNKPGDGALLNLDWIRFANPLTDPLSDAYQAVNELDAAIEAHKATLAAEKLDYLVDLSDRIEANLLSAMFGDSASKEFAKEVDKALKFTSDGLRWIDKQRSIGQLSAAAAAAMNAPLRKNQQSLSQTVSLLRRISVAMITGAPSAVPGEPVRVTSTLRNDGTTRVEEIALSLTVPPEWTARAAGPVEAQSVAPGGLFAVAWDVIPPDTAVAGPVTVAGHAAFANGSNAEGMLTTSTTLEVLPTAVAAAISLPSPVQGGTPATARVTVINNRTAASLDVTVALDVPQGWAAAPVRATVPAATTLAVDVPVTVPKSPLTAGQLKIETVSARVTATGATVNGAPTAQTYQIPAADDSVLALDSGSATSPLLEGYQRLAPADAWDISKGFGWTTTGVDFRDRGAPDALRRDFTLSMSPHVLRLQIPAGQHTVSLLRGDHSFSSGSTKVEIGSEVVVPSGPNLAVGQYAWEQFTVDGGATGRTVDLKISNENGDYWRLLALVIEKQ